jgi:hypothetical protein
MRASHISTSSTVFRVQHRISGQLMLIMTTGLLPNADRTPGWKPGGTPTEPTSAGRLPGSPPDACRTSVGRLPDAPLDAMKPGIHCVRTHWIRGFMAF